MKSFSLIVASLACFTQLAAAAELSLSDLDIAKTTQGWNTPKVNKAVTGKTLSIGKKEFANGFGTHSVSELWIKLDGEATRFTAEIGVDDAQNGTGTVEFIIIGDNEVLFRSDVMGAGEIKSCNVKLAGIKQLILYVGDGGDGTGNDHANWVNGKFRYSGQPPQAIARPDGATLPEIPLASSVRSYVKIIPDGYLATLFAGPPHISYPVQVCATPTGAVFVAIDKNGSLDKKPNRGSIVRATDSDNDGIADRFDAFVADVDSPRGLAWDGKQLFCLHPPTLTVYRDTDGDGKADQQQDLVTNFGYGLDKHPADHTSNGIRLAIDGWLYCAIGDFGLPDAKGSDGSTLALRGGGVVRVRPDGSELELYANHTRNIYDVAMDPLLNGFLRDNTNDGDGWNSRLSPLVQSGEYGYPSLYKRFSDDIIQPLADYGGGSAVGSLFVDEPMMPSADRHILLTCDWGTSSIYAHTMQAQGAGFTTEQRVWARIDRVTDLDVDGLGNLYASSWRGAVFTYNGEKVGAILRLAPQGEKTASFPDVVKASDADLVKTHLASLSAVCRQHAQAEILRRGEKGVFVNELTTLINNAAAPVAVRVAAVFTLKQLIKAKSHDLLIALTKDDLMEEWALRALTDRSSQLASVPNDPFIRGLRSANPRVRAQALISLGRLGKSDVAKYIVPLTAVASDAVGPDRIIPHLAVRSLTTLHAVEPCLSALDTATTNDQIDGALCALRNLHDEKTVTGLISRVESASPERRLKYLTTLAHLYFREGQWDRKHWWGTRPEHQGPYYARATWEGSAPIAELFIRLVQQGGETAAHVLKQVDFYKMKIDELTVTAGKNEKAQQADPQKDAELLAKAQQATKDAKGDVIANLGYEAVMTAALATKGDASKGEQLFLRQGCVACHTITKEGPQKGPYLGEIAKQYSRAELIESIVKPNAKVAQGFTTRWFELKDGQRLMGFVTSEGADTIELRNIVGLAMTIQVSDIVKRGDDQNSMMPIGLVNNLTTEELASMMAYFEALVGK